MVAQLGKAGNLPPVRGGVQRDYRRFSVRRKLCRMFTDRRPIPRANRGSGHGAPVPRFRTLWGLGAVFPVV